MIRLQRPSLFFLLCSVAVFLMPFLFGGFKELDAETVSFVGVIVLIGEVAAYGLWIGLFTQFNLIVLAGIPVGLAIWRFFLAGLGAAYVNVMGLGDGGDALMMLWLGQPVAAIFQVLVFIYMLPYLLAVIAPGVLTDTVFESIMGNDNPQPVTISKPASAPAASSTITPSGGMLQIYTLEDIPKFIEKIAGLEGYAIYTNEGLLFNHDLAQDQQVELLGVRVNQYLEAMRKTAVECDLEEPNRLILESENFAVFLSPITEHFWGLFVFNKNVPLDNCHGKIKVLTNSIKSFLTTRYTLS